MEEGDPALAAPDQAGCGELGPLRLFLPPEKLPSRTHLLLSPPEEPTFFCCPEDLGILCCPGHTANYLTTVPRCEGRRALPKVTLFGVSILILTTHRTAFTKVRACEQKPAHCLFSYSLGAKNGFTFLKNDYFKKARMFHDTWK